MPIIFHISHKIASPSLVGCDSMQSTQPQGKHDPPVMMGSSMGTDDPQAFSSTSTFGILSNRLLLTMGTENKKSKTSTRNEVISQDSEMIDVVIL